MRPKRTRIQYFAQILYLPNGNTATQLFGSGQRAGFTQTPNGRAGYPQQHQHYGEAYEGLIGKAVEIAQGIGKGGADAVRLRGNFTWLAVTACSFSFMDELQVCATDQCDMHCIQPSVFTVKNRNFEQP